MFDKESLIEKIRTMKKMSFSGKCIAKMFSLKRLLVSEYIFEIDFFCESCKESKLGICFTWVFSLKNLWTDRLSIERGFRGCGHGCGHGLGGFGGFDGFDRFTGFGGFNGLGYSADLTDSADLSDSTDSLGYL